jgi:ABC-type bacteriocin/lantibiotic exporter with double-glycine peptidase domain
MTRFFLLISLLVIALLLSKSYKASDPIVVITTDTLEIKHDSLIYRKGKDIRKDTTIYENITGKKEFYSSNDQKYISSIKFACADEFINNLDEKSNSIVGERGSLLSGGQRQRLAIARAIYREKEIIVLDEATSALDLDTEKNILNNLKTLNNKTIIMITHRRENIHMCSKVIDLNKN